MQIPSNWCTNLDKNKFTQIQKVIVVEKDTIFQRIITFPHVFDDPSVLCVTAKGYPDFATRKFLIQLASFGKQLFYIGDADPCGAEIFFTYVFGSSRYAICE